jgi:hypothetical protein
VGDPLREGGEKHVNLQEGPECVAACVLEVDA